MVEKGLRTNQTTEDEFFHIMKLIGEKKNFLLSGGAGSGKTYSLVQVIRKVLEDNTSKKIACITYTNAGVREIKERVNHKNLFVSTIHEFLWDNISNFQKELKQAIIYLVNDEDCKMKIKNHPVIDDSFFQNRIHPIEKIQYKEYTKLYDGIISHDEVLLVASYLLSKYRKLRDIIKNKYPFIFIDEYQDTNPIVVNVFLNYFFKEEDFNRSVIGLFGDSMQSIYDIGVGDIRDRIGNSENQVIEVIKKQNRRNPLKIINLANKLRQDGMCQEPSCDFLAPNMIEGEVRTGNIFFIYTKEDSVSSNSVVCNSYITEVKSYLEKKHKWSFDDTKETKELNLTYNLIAGKAGFRTLMQIYDNDPILALIKTLKENIKRKVDKETPFEISDNATLEQVLDLIKPKDKHKILQKEKILLDPKKRELFNVLKDELFSEVCKIYIDKDQLLDDKKEDQEDALNPGIQRDDLIKHLYKIQKCIYLYTNNKYHDFLNVVDMKYISSCKDKVELNKEMKELLNIGGKTIGDIIEIADRMGICHVDDHLNNFMQNKRYIYNQVAKVAFSEFRKLYEFLEGRTPFSTQHKIKGAEFDNVLVVMDNAGWNKYNYENLFLKCGNKNVLNRTQKLFYVCCTRAKENLVLFYNNPSDVVLKKAKEWFGESKKYLNKEEYDKIKPGKDSLIRLL